MSCTSFVTAVIRNRGYRQHKPPKDRKGCDNCSQTGLHLSKIRCSRIPEIVLRNTELFESICVDCLPIAFEIGSGGTRGLLDVAFGKCRIEKTALLTLVARADPECFQLLEVLCISTCCIDQAIFIKSIFGDEIARQLAVDASRFAPLLFCTAESQPVEYNCYQKACRSMLPFASWICHTTAAVVPVQKAWPNSSAAVPRSRLFDYAKMELDQKVQLRSLPLSIHPFCPHLRGEIR